MIRTILFDLDGTLVDTAPDLVHALNEMRLSRGLEVVATDTLRSQASHGSQGLLRAGFGVDPGDPNFATLRQEFLDLYGQELTRRSHLFPGMAQVLDRLEANGQSWGVVTNKPARYTEPLLDHLGIRDRAACVVSGDTCARSKPHPEPMLHACRLAAAEPADCLYVGDAARDVQAARAVGMRVVVALYGYLAHTDDPSTWGGDGFIRTPLELLDYVVKRP